MLFVFSYLELFSYPDLFFIEIKNFDKTKGKFLLEIKHDIFPFKTKLIVNFSLSASVQNIDKALKIEILVGMWMLKICLSHMENLNHNQLQCSPYHAVIGKIYHLKQHFLPPATAWRFITTEGFNFLFLLNFSFRGVEITHEGESIQLVNPFEIVAKDAVPMEVRLICSL